MDSLQAVLDSFAFDGAVLSAESFGSGHINDTFLVTTESNCRYVLQRINTYVFTDPQKLMENVFGVTEYLKKQIRSQGGDPNRETLTFIRTKDGKLFYSGDEGAFRAYRFLDGVDGLDEPRSNKDFEISGEAYGRFQYLLRDYPAETLHETIPRFHDTPNRYRQLREAIEADRAGRLNNVKEEIAFALEREDAAGEVMRLQNAGKLPIRVTHNDTKLNNVLLDSRTGKAVCVIDLDTVMPGQAIFDFGDSIRFGASTAAEDEPDLDKVRLDTARFDAYTRGFLRGCENALTPLEKTLLPTGAWMMTLECGVRFLADYLNGDVYFKTSDAEQNLRRARTQFKLVAEMEEKQDELQAITASY